ncbi:helix-turn-helix transcriptional regulator [Acinetobacter pollinis]|uniref:helix-turn-helix transcriptional regulator n=1 Tax=Acinetobacter pollinis TaxID=2605270 RepID=UPI0018A30684|nr:AlpA family phage regulatory protein [Acinetobacter pollinis]MBF7693909.1 transcriptional regulator [Acinetobacter pollinis]
MEIDRRIRAKEFMYFLGVTRYKFYELINKGDIQSPIKISERDVFWYSSYVKQKVEEHKKSDIVAT